MLFEIGKIQIDIPTDESKLGIAVIKGKFYPLYKELQKFEKKYRKSSSQSKEFELT